MINAYGFKCLKIDDRSQDKFQLLVYYDSEYEILFLKFGIILIMGVHMVRDAHGLPKVSSGPSMPYGRAIPWQGGWLAATFYPFRHPTPYAYDFCHF
jgi:hypothetical protein